MTFQNNLDIIQVIQVNYPSKAFSLQVSFKRIFLSMIPVSSQLFVQVWHLSDNIPTILNKVYKFTLGFYSSLTLEQNLNAECSVQVKYDQINVIQLIFVV